jgi:hypothetical protein
MAIHGIVLNVNFIALKEIFNMLMLQVMLWLMLSPVMIVFAIVCRSFEFPLKQYQEWGNGLVEKVKELK